MKKGYTMSIWEYINDPIDQEDYETHIYENVFALFAEQLPTHPYEGVLMWTDGTEILCKTESLAKSIADALDSISGERMSHYHWYEPNEDERDGTVDDHTGWWYVDYD